MILNINLPVDIDECTEKTHNCHLNATCSNTVGSFVCKCESGFRGDGVECIDINECWKPEDNTCKDKEVCLNLIGGYECTCKTGFRREGDECQGKIVKKKVDIQYKIFNCNRYWWMFVEWIK